MSDEELDLACVVENRLIMSNQFEPGSDYVPETVSSTESDGGDSESDGDGATASASASAEYRSDRLGNTTWLVFNARYNEFISIRAPDLLPITGDLRAPGECTMYGCGGHLGPVLLTSRL